jgi:putative alpha-1,2-mannosidase
MGAPLFKKATIHLENGEDFVIEAPENSAKNFYIDAAKLNGKTFTRNYLTHGEIMSGGKLNVTMSAEPNTSRATNAEDRPYSFSKDE